MPRSHLPQAVPQGHPRGLRLGPYRLIRPLTVSSQLGTGAILPHALPADVAAAWQEGLRHGGALPDMAGPMHAAFPLSQVGAEDKGNPTPLGRAWRRFKQITQKVITSVVLVSLQIGVISPLGHALAQSNQGVAGQMPNTGYSPNGDLYINGQRVGLSQDPIHQQLHNNQVPGLFMVDAVQFSFPVSDPNHGQGTLAQMENHTVNLGLPGYDLLFTRLYLTIANPYTTPDVGPFPNYQTYRDALTSANGANYFPVDGTYVFKTLTSPNPAMQNMLVSELPTHPSFQAALESPNGTPAGAVGVRVGMNGEIAALQEYLKTTKPFDFSYQSAMGPYATAGQRATYNPSGALDIDPTKDRASFFLNWVLGSTDVQNQLAQAQKDGLSVEKSLGALVYDSVTGRYYIPQGGAQEGQSQIFDSSFLAMAAPEQTVVTGGRNDGAIVFGQSGLPEWDQLNQAQQQSQAWHQEQQRIARTEAAQTSANNIDFTRFDSTNALFGQGYDLYRYDPQRYPNGEAENALMHRLMNGELAPGTPEYEQAKAITEQRYREQYAAQQITGSKLTFSVTDAQARANTLYLDKTNPNELFGQGFNLFDYAQNEEERQQLRRLQAGELVVGTDEYDRAAAVARQAFRNAYADNLANGTKKTYTDSAASFQANQLDLKDVSVTELFGGGFDLYRWANTDEERSLLRRLQSGELRPGTDEYKVALSLAQQFYRNSYAQMLNPPPPPPEKKKKKGPFGSSLLGSLGNTLYFDFLSKLVPTPDNLFLYIQSLPGQSTIDKAVVKNPAVYSILRTVVVAVATIFTYGNIYAGAGAGATFDAYYSYYSTGSINEALEVGGKSFATSIITAWVGQYLGGGSVLKDGKFIGLDAAAKVIGANAVSSALADTLVNGGSFTDNLEKSFKSAVLSALAQAGANEIGDYFKNTDGENVLNYIAHGLLACAIEAARTGGDKDQCAAAAAGAIAGELAAHGVNADLREVSILVGQIGGAIAGAVVNGNAGAQAGMGAAANAVENNYLNHTDVVQLERELKRCGIDLACRNKAFDDAFLASAKNDIELLQCASKGNCEQLKTEYRRGYEAITDLLDKGVSPNDVTRILSMENNAQMIIRNNLMTCRTADCKERAEFLLGVAKSIAWVTPTGALVGTGMGSYALMTSILQNGVTDTTLNSLKAVADLPVDIRNGLNSSDPQKRGEAIGAMLALGVGVGQIAKSIGFAKVPVKNPTSIADELYVDIFTPERRKHVLDGDDGLGGHLWPGRNLPGDVKTPFPEGWSGDKIIHEVGDILTSPNTTWYAQTGPGGIYTNGGKPAVWVAWEVRDGVQVRVAWEPATGRLNTAFPDPKGPPIDIIKKKIN